MTLDDFGEEATLRVATALVKYGFQAQLILSPNKEQVVVDALEAFGAKTVLMDFTDALQGDFGQFLKNTALVGAYVDATTCSPQVLQNMVKAVLLRSKASPLAIAYTMVERDFTAGGAESFIRRQHDMNSFMFAHDFLPQMNGNLAQSYFEPPRQNGRRAGTSFWLREAL